MRRISVSSHQFDDHLFNATHTPPRRSSVTRLVAYSTRSNLPATTAPPGDSTRNQSLNPLPPLFRDRRHCCCCRRRHRRLSCVLMLLSRYVMAKTEGCNFPRNRPAGCSTSEREPIVGHFLRPSVRHSAALSGRNDVGRCLSETVSDILADPVSNRSICELHGRSMERFFCHWFRSVFSASCGFAATSAVRTRQG